MQNTIIISENEQIAEAFNTYFISIIQSISESFSGNPEIPNFQDIENTYKSYDTFNFTEVNIEFIKKHMQTLKKTSCGPNGISSKYIFLCQDVFASFLLKIINLSFKTNTFPKQWKLAKIIPIHKAGNKKLVENYRPISILCNFSKVIERAAHCQITTFLSKNALLSNKQHGFRKQFSTLTAVTTLQNKILLNTDKQKACCVYLISEASKWVTGTNLIVDGGYTAR